MKNNALWHRFGYALAGLKASLASEKSVRLHVMAIAVGAVLLALLGARPLWWQIFLLGFGMMLSTELINTAMEKFIDHVHPEQHPAIKVVKDTLAAAVLVVCTAVGLAFLIFLGFKF